MNASCPSEDILYAEYIGPYPKERRRRREEKENREEAKRTDRAPSVTRGHKKRSRESKKRRLNRSPLLWGGGLYRSIVVDVIDPVCFLLSVPTQPTPLFHSLSCVSLLYFSSSFLSVTHSTLVVLFFSISSIPFVPYNISPVYYIAPVSHLIITSDSAIRI